jgi:hypothetical protein
VAFAPDGQSLATGEYGGEIKLRDASTGEVTAVLAGHEHGVNGLAYAPDGAALVSAGAGGLLKLWDMPGQQLRSVLHGHTDSVLAVAFFHHGLAVVSGSGDGTARIWDIATGQTQFTLRGHQGRIEAVAVAPGDQLLASAGADQTVRLWDATTGQERAVLEGHTAAVAALAFSPDGRLLASAAADGSICFWEVATGELVTSLEKQSAAIRALAIAPDGKSLATGSVAGVVLLALQVGDADEAEAPKKALAQKYAQSFRGSEVPPGWERRGPGAEQSVHFEPAGLRISLPKGKPADPVGTGVVTHLAVHGDFEMTVRFEILQEPTPADAGTRTRVSVEIMLDKPHAWHNMASITRKVAAGLYQFSAWQKQRDEAEEEDQSKTRVHGMRTEAKIGRLRLKRTGATLDYHVAEGDDGEFILLCQFPFGAEDLKEVRLVGETGGPQAALEVRLTDFQVRAEALPNLDEMQVTLPPPLAAKGRGAARTLLGLGVLVVLGMGLGVWIYGRRGRSVAKQP